MGAPGPILQLCRAGGGGVGTESCSQPRLTKKDQVPGHISQLRSITLVTQALAVLCWGRWALPLCSLEVPRALDLHPRGPGCGHGHNHYGKGSAVAGSLQAALTLGTVWPAVTALQRRQWLRAEWTGPISQPGWVAMNFIPRAHYHIALQIPSPLFPVLSHPHHSLWSVWPLTSLTRHLP